MLQWTTHPDGSETAGPFTVKDFTMYGTSFWRTYISGALVFSYYNADDAKSAAERIAQAIIDNVNGAK